MREYGVILADPPWSFDCWSVTAQTRMPDYGLMGTEGIAGLRCGDYAAPDCLLAMWATWAMLPDAMLVMARWGFTYRAGLPWVKTAPGSGGIRFGTGFWFRGASEPLLFGVRGDVGGFRERTTPIGLLCGDEWQFYGPSARHSEKPDLHSYLESFPGPYLELFARRQRPGWDCWGHSTGVELTPEGPRPYAPAETGLFAEAP